jgi:hypothetical protein
LLCAACVRFACCDLDSNGVITSDELRFFYRAQLHRITSLVRTASSVMLSCHD